MKKVSSEPFPKHEQWNITKIFKKLGAFFAPQKTGLSGGSAVYQA
jgi:hypothetical protein